MEPEVQGPANGARDVPCFNCRNSVSTGEHVARAGGGVHHQYRCRMGLAAPGIEPGASSAEVVARCPHGSPRLGFQIGGYYSHMWFDGAPGEHCLEWQICSDGQFPTDEPEIGLHICDFEQIERFVEFWGAYLRQRGIIPPRT